MKSDIPSLLILKYMVLNKLGKYPVQGIFLSFLGGENEWDRVVVSNSMAPDIIWKRIRKLNIPPRNVPEGHPVGSPGFNRGLD